MIYILKVGLAPETWSHAVIPPLPSKLLSIVHIDSLNILQLCFHTLCCSLLNPLPHLVSYTVKCVLLWFSLTTSMYWFLSRSTHPLWSAVSISGNPHGWLCCSAFFSSPGFHTSNELAVESLDASLHSEGLHWQTVIRDLSHIAACLLSKSSKCNPWSGFALTCHVLLESTSIHLASFLFMLAQISRV